MQGEINLELLLASIDPVLSEEEYVFFTPEILPPLDDSIFACIQEQEGWTCIIERVAADHLDMQYETIFKRITLQVHSSLEAVGLTAAVSNLLAEYEISCNIVAGYFHDHLFVPIKQADQALALLKKLKK